MRRLSILLVLVAVLFTILSSCNAKTKKTTAITEEKSILLAANDFETKLNATLDAQIVDVRTPGEFNAGYIKGAININYQGQSFVADIDKLDKSKPTFVYCQAGGRSSESCNYMATHGFKNIFELKNGFGSWSAMKKPFELNK